ncbi:hypothetical protein O9H85_10165 [Paenibacillus filicis]|uniref:GntR family transcriptional regulator n=1 Tax=Paenibacillus gyeongsangnamensis TaxID=3388067 RepID=A0ABT4Q7C6_9BACL|nr:hypothetical protein [Paenibacillus filicis]MCZ8512772.1 hypothetical protein [Paenibacillus filicis]
MNETSKTDAARSGQRAQLVYRFVLEGINRGEWTGQDKLPSVRSMAERLKVHGIEGLPNA